MLPNIVSRETVSERLKDCLATMWRLSTQWNPIPCPEPVLDPAFDQLPVIARVVEIMRYRLASLEFALSPCGSLREFRRFWLRLLLIFSIPIPVLLVLGYIVSAILELLLKLLTGVAILVGIVVLFTLFNSDKRK